MAKLVKIISETIKIQEGQIGSIQKKLWITVALVAIQIALFAIKQLHGIGIVIGVIMLFLDIQAILKASKIRVQ